MVRFGNEYAHPLAVNAMSMDSAASIVARTNIDDRSDFPRLRSEVQQQSKAAFDLTNKKHPEWEEFGFWE